MTTTQPEEKIFLKPGLFTDDTPMVVRKPTGQRLDPAGEWIFLDSYWRRRMLDKDVVEAVAPADVAAPDAVAGDRTTARTR